MDAKNLKYPDEVRRYALKLKSEGVTEEQYRKFIDSKIPNWHENENFRIRMETLFDILFHTFF